MYVLLIDVFVSTYMCVNTQNVHIFYIFYLI